MASIAHNWWNEDRRDLFHSLEVIASEKPDPDRVGLCLDTILNGLELYDDPRQGHDQWLFENELHFADEFGQKLNSTIDQTRLVEAGSSALGSEGWPVVRAQAAALLKLMAANGDFPS